jgi:protein TonB
MVKWFATSTGFAVRATVTTVLVTLWVSEVPASSQTDAFSGLQQGIELYWSGRYRETVDTLSPVCAGERGPRVDELVECFKYVAFSHVALGNSDDAVDAFARLLHLDSGFALDTASVSPKILDHFEASKSTVADRLFARGKALYFSEEYSEAGSFFDQALAVVPNHELAKEYKQLADERATLDSRRAGADDEPAASETATPTPAHAPAPVAVPVSVQETSASMVPFGVEAEKPYEQEPAVDALDPDDERVYHLTSQMTRPELLTKRDPVYPKSARLIRREGTVVITAVIDRDGSVRDAKVIRSVSPDIDNAALLAVLGRRYTPATLEGRPIAVYSVIQIAFEL